MALSTAPARTTPDDASAAATPRWSRRRTLWAALGALIVAQLVLRGWVLSRGGFYWDDLILIGRADGSVASWSYLGHNHDGHFMPGAFAVAGVTTLLAPLSWPAAAATLIIGQVIASVAVARMLLVVAGLRLATLAALAFYLFDPMTLPSFAWWAAGLNSLPLQAAMAWVVADAVLLCRGPRDGSAVTTRPGIIALRSSVVCAVGLAFFEKSALILPVAFVATVLCVRLSDGGRPLRHTVRRGRALWLGLSGVTAVWAVAFALVARPGAGDHSPVQTVKLVWRAVEAGVIPSLVGGPWTWDRWIPSPPFGSPGAVAIGAGWAVAVALVVGALWLRRGVGVIVVAAVGYVLVAQALVSWNRSSGDTALELSQTLRYLPDSALILALAGALVVAAPARGVLAERMGVTRRRIRLGVAAGTVAAMAGAMVSTVAFADRWHDGPTASYLFNARAALAANASTPMFDQAVPLEVLLPVAYPNNMISRVFDRLPHRPVFGDWTDRLQVLSPTGSMTPGAVTRTRVFAGGNGACDRPEITDRTVIGLDGPLIDVRWTVQIPYCANTSGDIEVAIGTGAPVRVPVRAGLHTLYVQASGTGDSLMIRPLTAGLAVHLAAGQVGQVYDPALF